MCLRGSLNKFQDFFVWLLLLIVHTWNSSLLRSNLLRLRCTCCTIPKNSGRPHGSPLVWACQWPSSQSLSSPQLSHSNVWTIGRLRNSFDSHLGQIVCEPEIIKIGQSSQKMHCNNILNFQDSTTILNARTKKTGNLSYVPRISNNTSK